MKDKRIVVTGASGFLGRHLIDRLRAVGYSDVEGPRYFNLVSSSETFRMYEAFRPEIVINLAAVIGGIGANQAAPADFLYGNAMIGMNMIHAANQYGVEKFIQIGSACAYPKDATVPLHEDDIWNGYPEVTNAPYAIAKRLLLEQLQAYRKQYGLNGVYLIPTNLYGPGDNFNPSTSHVIPATILRVRDAIDDCRPSITVWGSGNATRDFLYVEDCVDGVILALEKYNGAEPINLGSGKETSISWMVEEVADILGYNGEIIYDRTRPDGQPRRLLDTTRAKEYLGFEAKTKFHAGLVETIRWAQGFSTVSATPKERT